MLTASSRRCQGPAGLHTFIVGGFYNDTCQRTADGWRIVKKVEEQSYLTGGLAARLRRTNLIPASIRRFAGRILRPYGLWRSLVAHLTGGQGVAGSNPVSPTTFVQVRASNPHRIGMILGPRCHSGVTRAFRNRPRKKPILLSIGGAFPNAWYGRALSAARPRTAVVGASVRVAVEVADGLCGVLIVGRDHVLVHLLDDSCCVPEP